MFIGHFAVSFAAKAAAPKANLATYVVAGELLDLIWPVLVLLGIEQVRIDPGNTAVTPLDFISYPWSHSLVMAAVWGAVFGGLHYARRGDRRTALMLAGVVFSHWVLDWVSHRADMPIAPGLDLKVGLGLWYSVLATVVVEGGMFAVGVAWYVGRTRPTSRAGVWLLWSFVVALVAIYLGNLFGPPPPSVTGIIVAGIAGAAILFVWAWAADRYRR